MSIADLNDAFRRSLTGRIVVITRGVAALPESHRNAAVEAVRRFETFDEDNDPAGEHDFGACDIAGARLFWKIDYYDLSREMASPDPANPAVTTRVLTILLADEY